MKPLLPLLMLMPALRAAAEELPLDYPQAGGWKSLKVPEGAAAALRLPEKALIGEQVPAALSIQNRGPQPFEITTGGDYRATGFPQRMKVRVRDADGLVLRELSPANYGMGGGGILGSRIIQPGGSQEIEFPLERYVSFPKAGTYTVLAGHDLGWQRNPEKPHPLGVATIIIDEPTPEQAERLVKSIIEHRQTTPTHVGFRGKSYPPMREETLDSLMQAKLNVLRHPGYLPALLDAVKNGTAEAVSGIGHIATAEATEALLSLLQSDMASVQSEALNQLQNRVPDKTDPARPAVAGMWGGDTFQIDPLLPGSWKPEFEPRLAAESARLLLHADPSVVSAAARLVEGVGTNSAAKPLLEALQRSLDTPRDIARQDTAALYPPLPEPAILSALDALRRRGWRSPRPGGTALLVARFREYADESMPKHTDDPWEESMLTWVEHGPPTLKENALRAIPLPLSPAAVNAVLKALEDDDPRVLVAACQVAEKSALKNFIRPLCQLVETDRSKPVYAAAIEAAKACGARMELWRVIAETMVVKELLADAAHALVSGTIALPEYHGRGSNSSFSREQRFQMREAWRAFLQKHQETLTAGGKVPVPEPAEAAPLTGMQFDSQKPVWEYSLKDGSRWPASR